MPKSIIQSKEQAELYSELKKLAKRANQRIVRLERAFGQNTWATRELESKLATEPLQAWTKKRRVKYNKQMTETQLQATIKITENFLKNTGISTVKGIKKARQQAIKTIQTRFSTQAKKISYEEAQMYMEIFYDDEFNGITNYLERK